MLRTLPCAALLLVLSSLPVAAGPVTLLSRADPDRPSGTAGGTSWVMGISADSRYVVFLSLADNLLPGVTDTNAGSDIFLHDRVAGTTVLVSHAAGDPTTAGNGAAGLAVLSADGRWVAFVSVATNLVAGQVDEPSSQDLFLWDRDTGLVQLVSHQAGLSTTAAGGCSDFAGRLGISADGNRIAFSSDADNLVAGQTVITSVAAFLYDRATGTNALVSHSSSSSTEGRQINHLALSSDGSWVVFVSNATDLVAGQVDTNSSGDYFLYDVSTGANVLVSHAAGSAVATGNGGGSLSLFGPRISADGGRIAYESLATNLMAGQSDGNGDVDVFLYDRATGTNTLVSHTSSSATTAGEQYSENISLSADGRYIAYLSGASDLVADDPSPWQDVFFYDHVAGTNLLVSRGSAPSPFSDSFDPRISSDGAWIAFSSRAPNLVSGQIDGVASLDGFLWSRATGTITLVTRTPASATTAIGLSTDILRPMLISADGSWIALSCSSDQLVEGIDDHNGLSDAFLYERATGVHRLLTPRGGAVSVSAGGQIEDSTRTAMSNDGRYIVFTSDASNLPGVTDGNDESDLFLHDRMTGTTALVSHASGFLATASDGTSYLPLMSGDGTAVVFQSSASDLVTGPGPHGNLYLYERTSGVVTLIDHVPSSPSIGANGSLEDGHAVSGDGRWVAYTHTGSLIDGQVDGNSGADIFLFDRTTSMNTLVSHASSSPVQTGDGTSRYPSISADGRYLAFASTASNLAPGQTGAGGIFLYDRMSGASTRVSSSGTRPFAISGDGRWIVFTSNATDVVPGQVDTNSATDVFLWDRVSGSTLLVSRALASPTTTGNGSSDVGTFAIDPPALSADGRWVVFSSNASNLISGQTGQSGALFLFDRIAGAVTLVSRSAASPSDARNASKPAISADGRFVAFTSIYDDLVPGQISQGLSASYFLYDRIAGTTALVSHIPSSDVTSGTSGDSGTFGPRISADGAWIAFHSPMSDLVAGDHDGTDDAFLYANPLPGRDLYTISPCRIVDTRQAGQGPILTSGLKRMVMVHGVCGIPATARAVAVNVTVFQPSASGNLSFYAGDLAPSGTSTINFPPGETRANNAILPLAFDGTGTVAVTPSVAGSGTVHLIVDVSGYFE